MIFTTTLEKSVIELPMMTTQQAYRLFVYADWAMLIAALAAIVATVGWGLYAIFPRNKGRRKRVLQRALMCFLVFAMLYGTQWSMLISFFNQQWTPLLIVLFALPVLVMLVGLIASIGYGGRAILWTTGKQRRHMVLRSLLGMAVFGVGLAPHAIAMLMPILSAEDHANLPGTLTHVGELCPDFELTSVDGTPFHVVELRGNVILLNYFATGCGACQMELPHLQVIWNEFQNDGDFRMLVVGREESDDRVKAFRQENRFTFPMASDPDKSVYNKFAAHSVPRTYLISRQGTIIYQCAGYYDEEIAKLKKLLKRELAKAE